MKNNIQLNVTGYINPYLAKFNVAQLNLNLLMTEEPQYKKKYRKRLIHPKNYE